ncbi:MAG: FHA domain-containing protein [Chloroflexota bacterium]
MTRCPECQAPLAENANFCDNCGRPIQAARQAPAAAPSQPTAPREQVGVCSACGFANLPGELFCQQCGVQLPPVASQPPPLPTPAEIRAPGLGAPMAGEAGSGAPAPGALEPAAGEQGGTGFLPRSAAPRQAPAAAPHPALPQPPGKIGRLLVRDTRRAIPLPDRPEIILGRSDPVRGVFPDIDLAAHGGESSGVSRRHARLLRQEGQLYLEDLNSTNYTFLNRRKLDPGHPQRLQFGDEIRMGLLVLEYWDTDQ